MENVGVKVQKEALKKLTDIYRIPKKEEPKCHKDKRKGGERGSQAESSKRSLRVRKLTAVEQRMPWTTNHSKNLLHSNREQVLRLRLLLPL